MSNQRGPVGTNPHHPSHSTPGPKGVNDAASPNRAKWHVGNSPGPQGYKDNTLTNAGNLVTAAITSGILPLSGALRADGPMRVPPENVEDLLAPRGAKLKIGGIWGDVTAGSSWMATDGKRFVMSATSTDVVYYLKGTFYYQLSKSFIGEVTTYPFVEAGRRSLFLVTISECEMKLIMGIVAGASGVGFAIVVGTEVLEFVAEHSKDFQVWTHILRIAFEVRESLKTVAPTLYDKLFDAIFKVFLKDVWAKLGNATTPEILSFMVGVILGHIAHHLDEATETGSAVAPVAILWIILEAMVKRFFLSVVPTAIAMTSKEYGDIAKDMVATLKEHRVAISQDDMVKIVQEVQRHPAEIKAAVAKLRGALDQLKPFKKENGTK